VHFVSPGNCRQSTYLRAMVVPSHFMTRELNAFNGQAN